MDVLCLNGQLRAWDMPRRKDMAPEAKEPPIPILTDGLKHNIEILSTILNMANLRGVNKIPEEAKKILKTDSRTLKDLKRAADSKIMEYLKTYPGLPDAIMSTPGFSSPCYLMAASSQRILLMRQKQFRTLPLKRLKRTLCESLRRYQRTCTKLKARCRGGGPRVKIKSEAKESKTKMGIAENTSTVGKAVGSADHHVSGNNSSSSQFSKENKIGRKEQCKDKSCDSYQIANAHDGAGVKERLPKSANFASTSSTIATPGKAESSYQERANCNSSDARKCSISLPDPDWSPPGDLTEVSRTLNTLASSYAELIHRSYFEENCLKTLLEEFSNNADEQEIALRIVRMLPYVCTDENTQEFNPRSLLALEVTRALDFLGRWDIDPDRSKDVEVQDLVITSFADWIKVASEACVYIDYASNSVFPQLFRFAVLPLPALKEFRPGRKGTKKAKAKAKGSVEKSAISERKDKEATKASSNPSKDSNSAANNPLSPSIESRTKSYLTSPRKEEEEKKKSKKKKYRFSFSRIFFSGKYKSPAKPSQFQRSPERKKGPLSESKNLKQSANERSPPALRKPHTASDRTEAKQLHIDIGNGTDSSRRRSNKNDSSDNISENIINDNNNYHSNQTNKTGISGTNERDTFSYICNINENENAKKGTSLRARSHGTPGDAKRSEGEEVDFELQEEEMGLQNNADEIPEEPETSGVTTSLLCDNSELDGEYSLLSFRYYNEPEGGKDSECSCSKMPVASHVAIHNSIRAIGELLYYSHEVISAAAADESMNMPRIRDMASKMELFWRVAGLESALELALKNPASSYFHDLAYLFSEFAIVHMKWLFYYTGENEDGVDSKNTSFCQGSFFGQLVLRALLKISSVPNSFRFDGWVEIESYTQVWVSHSPWIMDAVLRLVPILRKASEYPMDLDFENNDEQKEAKAVRYRAADLLNSCTNMIGSHKVMLILFDEFQSCLKTFEEDSSKWRGIESCLYSFRAIGGRIKVWECRVIPKVMDFIISPACSPHSALRYTGTLIIGRYTEWIFQNWNYYLDKLFDFLVAGTKSDSPMVVNASTYALNFLCGGCGDLIAQLRFHQLFELHKNSSSLPIQCRKDVAEALASVIRSLPEEGFQMYRALKSMISTHLEELEKAFRSKDFRTRPEFVEKVAAQVELITQMVQNMDQTSSQQFAMILKLDIKPIFDELLEAALGIDPLVERICRFWKYTMRSIDSEFIGLVEPFVKKFCELFGRVPHPSFVYCIGVILEKFHGYPRVRGALHRGFTRISNSAIAILADKKACMRKPDIISDLYDLQIRTARKMPAFYVSSGIAEKAIECALRGLGVPNKDVSNTLLQFFNTIIDSLLEPFGPATELEAAAREQEEEAKGPGIETQAKKNELFEKYGEKIVYALFEGMAGKIPEDRVYKIAKVFVTICKHERREDVFEWAEEALRRYPPAGASSKDKFMEALRNHKSLSSRRLEE